MPIASRASCSPRIGTRRLRPHAPRAAQSHALCKPAGTAAGHGAATGRLFESPSPPHRSTIRSGGHPGILGEQLGAAAAATTRGSKSNVEGGGAGGRRRGDCGSARGFFRGQRQTHMKQGFDLQITGWTYSVSVRFKTGVRDGSRQSG